MYEFEKSIIYVLWTLSRILRFSLVFKIWSHVRHLNDATIYKNTCCRKNKEPQVYKTLSSSVIAVPCQFHIHQLFLEINAHWVSKIGTKPGKLHSKTTQVGRLHSADPSASLIPSSRFSIIQDSSIKIVLLNICK